MAVDRPTVAGPSATLAVRTRRTFFRTVAAGIIPAVGIDRSAVTVARAVVTREPRHALTPPTAAVVSRLVRFATQVPHVLARPPGAPPGGFGALVHPDPAVTNVVLPVLSRALGVAGTRVANAAVVALGRKSALAVHPRLAIRFPDAAR